MINKLYFVIKLEENLEMFKKLFYSKKYIQIEQFSHTGKTTVSTFNFSPKTKTQ
jgi:hypothetical protein